MALIKCPECNREISDQAVSCPHCGFPLANKTKEKPKQPDIDFSSMEVVLERGVTDNQKAKIICTMILSVLIAIGMLIFTIYHLSVISILFLLLVNLAASYALAMFVVTIIKMKHNPNLHHHCMYYDVKSQKFYIETWHAEIVELDAHKYIDLKRNSWTFEENLVVCDGKKYNVGYSSTDMYEGYLRVKAIRESLEKSQKQN